MARVNIEDSIYKDERFINLAIEMRGKYPALGALVSAWSIAQQWFLKSATGDIPLDEWAKFEAGPLVESVGFASRRETGVYMRGAREQFAWLKQRSEAGRKNIEEFNQRPLDDRSTTDDGRTSSLLSSLSLSSSSSLTTQSHNSNTTARTRKRAEPNPKNRKTWEAYRNAYEARHGNTLKPNAGINSMIKRLVENIGDDAPAVAAFYVSHNDFQYVKSLHPMTLLIRDWQALQTQWVTGQRMTGAKARDIERMSHNADVFTEAAARINAREAKNAS